MIELIKDTFLILASVFVGLILVWMVCYVGASAAAKAINEERYRLINRLATDHETTKQRGE